MERPLVLLVEGESATPTSVRSTLEEAGFEVLRSASASEAMEALRTKPVRLLLADVRAPGVSAGEFLQRARRIRPMIVPILLGPETGIRDVEEALRAGAFDLVSPEEESARLVLALRRAEEQQRFQEEFQRLRDEVRFRAGFHRLVGRSEAMERLRERIERFAETDLPVLFTGEAGVGKELSARTLHALSARRDKPFVSVQCAGTTADSLSAELFGVARGSLPGVERGSRGLLDSAEGGTLFLDEISAMPLAVQEKLVEALGRGFVQPVGGGHPAPLDVRILSASTVDPERAVADDRFREDLYRRLAGARVRIPPLRERLEDVPLLAQSFVDSIRRINDLPPIRIASETMAVLERHRWSGNVRELRNVVEQAVILAAEGVIRPRDLPERVALPEEGPSGPERPSAARFRDAKHRVVESFERSYLSDLLESHRGNVTAAAQHAGMLRSALQRLLRKYDLRSSEFRRERRSQPAREPS